MRPAVALGTAGLPLFGRLPDRGRCFVPRARPLSYDVPKTLFPRPQNFFPRPERLSEGITFKDIILSQENAVKQYPWEYMILLCFIILVVLEIVLRPYDEEKDKDQDKTPPKQLTREEATILALHRIRFQAENTKNLVVLGGFAALTLWIAGFLNHPHPFVETGS